MLDREGCGGSWGWEHRVLCGQAMPSEPFSQSKGVEFCGRGAPRCLCTDSQLTEIREKKKKRISFSVAGPFP